MSLLLHSLRNEHGKSTDSGHEALRSSADWNICFLTAFRVWRVDQVCCGGRHRVQNLPSRSKREQARSFELTPALVSSVPSASDSSSLRFTAFVCVLFSFVKRSNTIKKILKIIKLPFKIFKQVYGILGILGDEKVLDSFFFLFFLFPSFSFPLCPLSPSLPLPLLVSLSWPATRDSSNCLTCPPPTEYCPSFQFLVTLGVCEVILWLWF